MFCKTKMAKNEQLDQKISLYISVIENCDYYQEIITVRRSIMEERVKDFQAMLPVLHVKAHKLFDSLYQDYLQICVEAQEAIVSFQTLRKAEDYNFEMFQSFTHAGINLKHILKKIDKYVSHINNVLVAGATGNLDNIAF